MILSQATFILKIQLPLITPQSWDIQERGLHPPSPPPLLLCTATEMIPTIEMIFATEMTPITTKMIPTTEMIPAVTTEMIPGISGMEEDYKNRTTI